MYEQIVSITQDYLGPAAKRFIDRQIRSHLGKNPENVTQADIPKLFEWMKVSFCLLTNDHEQIDNFEKSIMALAKR